MYKKDTSRPVAIHHSGHPGASAPEAGYMLLAVVVMVVLVLLTLSVAAPVVARHLRREKEVESQHRAEQYVRAIRLYYRKTHNYPPSIDALKSTNNVRFLRQEYLDPLTGKSDWRILHLGEQKTTIKGFFGQELGGLSSGGLGSAAGMNSGVGSSLGSSFGASGVGGSTIGATSPLSSGFQDATVGSSSSSGSTLGSLGSSGSTGSSGSSGIGGGGAIIGVGTTRTGESITQPNQQASYEKWEFWYDPRIEQLYQKGLTNMGVGSGSGASKSASSFGSDLNGQPNSTASPFGNSSGTSTSGAGSTAPGTTTTPQP